MEVVSFNKLYDRGGWGEGFLAEVPGVARGRKQNSIKKEKFRIM